MSRIEGAGFYGLRLAIHRIKAPGRMELERDQRANIRTLLKLTTSAMATCVIICHPGTKKSLECQNHQEPALSAASSYQKQCSPRCGGVVRCRRPPFYKDRTDLRQPPEDKPGWPEASDRKSRSTSESRQALCRRRAHLRYR